MPRGSKPRSSARRKSSRAKKPTRAARRSRRTARPVTRAGRPTAKLLVAVDVGNSETTVGVFRRDVLLGFWRLTSGPATADELRLKLDSLLRDLESEASEPPPAPDAGVLCSVVPALTSSWAEALTRLTGRAALEVNAATTRGLRIRYHDKNAVGADRIANAIAVRALYGTPAIVVDLGTATTFDCISAEGAYLGGAIAPGLGTSAEELFRRAARLPRVELKRPLHAVGRTTEESLQAGVVWGAAGQVDALVRRLTLEMRGTPHVIATGGYASVVAPSCETINRIDESLTLKGLRLLWEESR